jgi:glycosyltransferase 2 family protein
VKSFSKLFLAVRMLLLFLFLMAVVWTANKFDWKLIGRELRSASVPGVMTMAVIWIIALLVRPIRLLVLMRAMAPDAKRRYWALWSANVISMATNSIIPMRAGDLMMAFTLRQSLDVTMARSSSIVLVDRFFDFTTVIVIFVAMLSVAPTVAPWAGNLTVGLLAALALLVIGLFLAIRLRHVWTAIVDRALAAAVPRQAGRWGARLHDLFDGLAMIDRPGVIVPLLLLSVCLWGITGASYWFGANAVWPHVSLVAAALTGSAIALATIMPAPAGLGVFQGAAVLALSLFGMPAEAALAFAIIAHVFQLGAVLVLGAIAVICQAVSVRTLIRMDCTQR